MISTSVTVWRSTREQDLDALIDFMTSRLNSELQGLHVEAITARKKSAASIQQKLQTGRIASIDNIRDLAGLTVVLLYRSEIPRAIELVKSSGLQVDDPGPVEVAPSDFKYHEPKLFAQPPATYLDRHPSLVNECEIQFTTLLQHALDTATHDFDYKGRSYSWSNFRLVAQLRSMLEMVDRTIDGIESSALPPDPTVGTPDRIDAAAAVLSVLSNHFPASLPDDRRRLADTVLGWLRAANASDSDLDLALTHNADLVTAKSLDPTSATLGALLRDHPAMASAYEGRFFVSPELKSLCDEAAALSGDRLVQTI